MNRRQDVARPAWLYHITDVDNLWRIEAEGALRCKAAIDEGQIGHVNIAYLNVQAIRRNRNVPLPPGGTLSDYVPFYFTYRSPMLYALHTGQVAGYTGGQNRIVHLITSAQKIAAAGLRFVFTNGHAIMRLTDYYDSLDQLDQIDWEVIGSTSWSDRDDDPDRKRRKQAEFLVWREVPLDLIVGIGVIDNAMARSVRETLQGSAWHPEVVVRPHWYYE